MNEYLIWEDFDYRWYFMDEEERQQWIEEDWRDQQEWYKNQDNNASESER